MSDTALSGTQTQPDKNGILGWIERSGNRLPDPVFLFFWLIAILVLISIAASLLGWSAAHPTEVDPDTGTARIITAASLLNAENIQRLWVDMPTTFTHFHPLGYVLVVMLGAGVAERAGLFGTAMRAGVRNAPVFLLTPIVALIGMLGNLAADAAYVVLIPLAGIIFHAAGRHPIAGIAASFAGVSGGFSANLLPGQLDALLFGITEAAVETVFGDFTANIAGNWYFIAAMTFVFLPVIWFVTDRIIEPRLGKWNPAMAGNAVSPQQRGTDTAEAGVLGSATTDLAEDSLDDGDRQLTANEAKGLRWAGLAVLFVVGLWLFFTLGPGTPLIDEEASAEARLTPFYRSLVAGFFLLFLLAGWAYGKAAGTIGNHRDLVKMMAGAMEDLAYYLVLAFAAAHFVAMFAWSNLGLILAVQGADFLGNSGLPAWALLAAIILVSSLLNIFVGSASAKWALLSPVLVPMLMLLGISPEMATAAYRVGDGATNIITPLMVYFPLILIFCQRWQKDFGLGSLAATMLPFSIGLLLAGLAMTIGWVALDLPLGPGAGVFIEVPSTVDPVAPAQAQ
ncbi:p-aminobenzoyl-glutamate transport protein [Alteripontixanthobacter maritimus]|uniref:p-aminobenzoyl-glutamate transport protein n=1 Tax=Alteripontixanthobacter maritimus TaxID=2161824 RepID=A0A369Q3H7_9SPHN|nr:AbgT family transporter [Alteripontixanthobacter maritimus]RDC59443.1 p-aminobenzoyl-glutamate transport protein [Alteripontixanthobacter maritimus]